MSRYAKPITRHTPPARPTMPTAPTATIGAYQGRPSARPSADKGQDMWRTVTMSYRTAATHDARWSRTASQ